MRHDDATRGSLLSRRETIALLGSGAAWAASALTGARAAAPTQSCVVRPQQTEGPYFVDDRLNRSDIRSDPSDGTIKAGTPLALTLLVSQLDAGNCRPLPGAIVDIWHCDAEGVYSDVEDMVGRKFLRGYQVTNAGGEARFVTIFPGSYPGRTVHIHFKIRSEPGQRGREFTSQLYFDDATTQRVHETAPYARGRSWSTPNQRDRIFRRGGDQLTLQTLANAGGQTATFALSLDLS